MSVSNAHAWTVRTGRGPIIATAIHDGHDLRPEVAAAMALGDADRLREEDPFTGQAVRDVGTHIVVHRSRFEVDLNRAAAEAVYVGPEQSWGLQVWRPGAPDDGLVKRSLALHEDYYRMLGALLGDVAAQHRRFVLI